MTDRAVDAPLRVAILTISDAGARGERADGSGDRIAEWAGARGAVVTERELVPDETVEIVRRLTSWADQDQADLILTTGGTGLSPRDVTPEATRAVLERYAPGIAEAIRSAARAATPRASLGRGLAGTRARTLIVNLPGSPGGVTDGLAFLDEVVDHAVAVLRGRITSHDPTP